MSILYSNESVVVVSHMCYLTEVYKNVARDKSSLSFKANSGFFAACIPFKTPGKFKKKCRRENSKTADFVLNTVYSDGMLIKEKLKCSCCCIVKEQDALVAKSVADQFSEGAVGRLLGGMKGGNSSDTNIIVKIDNSEYLIPRFSKFYNYDVCKMNEHLLGNHYDLIVLDPPWWNKFIRRKKAAKSDCYKMMSNDDLAKLPIKYILKDDGLVAIWCTNAESHSESLINQIFPVWGLEYVATWFWLKTTTQGEPVTPFSAANGKQPFERIIFAARTHSRQLPLPEEKKILVSVPSSIHSHKPPLCELMSPYISPNANCLEIFARYLLPNWTSYGNEVLKLQHISFFTETEAPS